jgi:predicted dehydrogenase
MRQVLVRQGRTTVNEVPAPEVQPGSVLVRVDHSCISVGTEVKTVQAAEQPVWRRALEQPEKVKRGLQMLATEGVARTWSAVEGKLSAGVPLGYSAAGEALEVAAGVEGLRRGDRVACAGAQWSHHAEIVCVPKSLVVPVPEGVDLAAASTVALGAIALQGLRRAQPTLGERVAVIGLGTIGQLAVQLLRAAGCVVIGLDLDRERIRLAAALGMEAAGDPDEGDNVERVVRWTGGIGADAVIVAAGGTSDAVISSAFRMCRKKGRVVLVGDVGLKLSRADFYEKEIDFLISTSYGPGRYDPCYEVGGQDYPLPYVRWTENRNMAEYLRLLAAGRLRIEPLIGRIFPVERASEAFEHAKREGTGPPIVLLAYPRRRGEEGERRVVPNPSARTPRGERLRIALVGAGEFARGTHLPNLAALSDRFHLQAVMSRSGHGAAAAATQFGARYSTTDFEALLADPEVDVLLIATRHDLHARQALAALRAGKHVLVEKPLALTREELSDLEAFFASSGGSVPVLLTGFNRRFSPCACRMREIVAARGDPMILDYRMNAGHVPLNHWVHGPEGGGRNLGEACHVYDLFTYLTGARVVSIDARAIVPRSGHYAARDNFAATVTFDDGSVATLTYTALGSRDHPKEMLEVFVDGKVLVLDDYRSLRVVGTRAKGVMLRAADKGHRAELVAFADTVQRGGDWPSPLWQQIQATEIALRVEEAIGSAS